jgi:hypothetical protein
MLHRVALVRSDVLEECITSIISVTRIAKPHSITSQKTAFSHHFITPVQLFSSATRPQTLSVCVPPLMIDTKFHTHQVLRKKKIGEGVQ